MDGDYGLEKLMPLVNGQVPVEAKRGKQSPKIGRKADDGQRRTNTLREAINPRANEP